jgi:hypothetical protein
METTYRTVGGEAQAAFTERRSRFIGTIRPVISEEEALAFLQEKKKEAWDATHNVYAYCIREGGVRRYSDDGEPQGTAGIPVLDVLQKNGLTDCAVVVTRYFGGILLGGGGLVRAYSHAAALAVEAAGVREMVLCDGLTIVCDYGQYGWAAPLIAAEGGLELEAAYTDVVTLTFWLQVDRVSALQKKLTEASAGRLSAAVGERRFMPCSVADR